MTPRRDLDREAQFIRRASPFAPSLRGLVRDRLAAGEREYGDSWATRPLAELLWEIMEECADIGGWAALADQALDKADGLTTEDRDFIEREIRSAPGYAAFAYARVGNARLRLLKPQDGDDGHV